MYVGRSTLRNASQESADIMQPKLMLRHIESQKRQLQALEALLSLGNQKPQRGNLEPRFHLWFAGLPEC